MKLKFVRGGTERGTRWAAWASAVLCASALALGGCPGDNNGVPPADAPPDAPVGLCDTDNGGCDQLTTCTEDGGVVTCGACPEGYTGTGADGCDDIDECATDNGGCAVTCNNTPGGFECSLCPEGFDDVNGDGTQCVDIDECQTNNGGCDHTCTNSEGGFACSCDDGYTLNQDGESCDDIDECATDNGGCEQACDNEDGGFSCDCDGGYALNQDGASCDDIDECQANNGGCAHYCDNTEGGFACSCDVGYELAPDGLGCDDIDECATDNGGCGDAFDYTCTNNLGAAPTCGCVVPAMCDPSWVQVYGLTLPSGIVNWDNAAQIPYSLDDAANAPQFERVGYYLRLNDTFVWTDFPAYTANASQIGLPIDWIWDIPLTDITIVTNSGNLSNLTGGSGNMEFWSNCYSTGAGGVYDEDDDLNGTDCYGSMQVHEGGRTVFAFNAWSAANEATESGIGDNTGNSHPDWTFMYNNASYATRELEVWVKRRQCLNGDTPGPNGGCMLQTVCGQPVPEVFAGGNCSDNTDQFADWYCQLGGYAGAVSYTEITSGVYNALYYNGGNQAVLSSCGQVSYSGYGMADYCTSADNLECGF